MSVIVKAGSDICKANTNTSTAKFQYSFSKASRFPIPNHAEEIRKKRIQDLVDKGELEPEKPKKAINYEYQYYKLLPSTLSQRKTTFGKGNKSDFTKGGNTCQKAYYDPYTDFDQKNPHGPKYSFTKANRSGKGPTKTKKQENEEKEKEEHKDEPNQKTDPKDLVDIDGPSPARYNYLKQFGWDAPKISMKGRHNTPIKKKGEKEGEESDKKEEPPYLTKVTIQIRNNGKYVVSQIPNVNSLKFDKDKSRRTQFVANKNPGPCYDIKPLLGRVAQSQYRSYEPIVIASRHPVKDSRSNYPGPGSYPLPSDFGIYQSKDASKYPQEKKKKRKGDIMIIMMKMIIRKIMVKHRAKMLMKMLKRKRKKKKKRKKRRKNKRKKKKKNKKRRKKKNKRKKKRKRKMKKIKKVKL